MADVTSYKNTVQGQKLTFLLRFFLYLYSIRKGIPVHIMLQSTFFGNEFRIKTNTKQLNNNKNIKQASKKPTKQQQFKDEK